MLPAALKAAAEANAKYETRVFEVRPDFLVQLQEALRLASKPPAISDPFAPKPEDFARVAEAAGLPPSVQALLEKAGIPFPEGSAAFFDAPNSLLHIRHEPLYLRMVEGVIASRDTPIFITLTAHVIQAPSDVLQEMIKPDRDDKQTSNALKQLLLESSRPESEIKVLYTSHVETCDRQQVRLEAVTETPVLHTLGKNEKGAKEVHSRGLKFEVETTVQLPRSPVIDLNISLEFPEETQAIPGAGQDHKALENAIGRALSKSLKTTLKARHGEPQISCLWKAAASANAPGRGDSWQALLLTAHIIQLKPLPKPITQGVKMDLSHMSETISHTFEMPDERWLNDYRYLGTDSFGELPPVLRKSLDGKAESHLKDRRHIEIKGGHQILDSFQQWVHERWNPTPNNISVTLKILQGPANEVRRLMEKSQGQSDHTALLAEAKAMVKEGTARWCSTAFLQSELNEKAVTSAAREHSHFPTVSDPAAPPAEKLTAAIEPLGTVLEIQPTLQENGYGMDLQYSLAWQTAARKENAGPATGEGLEKSGPSRHHVRLSSTIPFVDGSTRLVAACNSLGPSPQGADDIMEIAFVTVDYQRFLSSSEWDDPSDNTYGEPEKPAEFAKRTLRVVPNFLSLFTARDDSGKTLSSSEKAQKIFESQGVRFPLGSRVTCVVGNDTIEVTNTRHQLWMMELCLALIDDYEFRASSFNLHLFQAEGEMIRDLLDQSVRSENHEPALNRLLEGVKAGNVVAIDTLRLSSQRSQRGIVQQTQEVSHTVAAQIHARGQMKSVSGIKRVGSMLEIEPYSMGSQRRIAISLATEFSTAPWITHRQVIPGGQGEEAELTDFHTESLKASVVFPSQSTRIVAVWKPTGKAEFEEKDILHIAIMETELNEFHRE